MMIGVNWSADGPNLQTFTLESWEQLFMFFSLEGEPQNTALELGQNAISSKDGVKKILAQLQKLYKKDDGTLSKFKVLDAIIYNRVY